jgi:hypothetical protein
LVKEEITTAGREQETHRIHTDVCERHVLDDRTVHRRVLSLISETVD